MIAARSGERSVLDGLLALLALTDIERETWVDVHVVGLAAKHVAERDRVSQACISLRLRRAEKKLEAVTAGPVGVAA